MNFSLVTPEQIELTYYDIPSFELIWHYIGPQRDHGDLYYTSPYRWGQCIEKDNVAIFCLTTNSFFKNSLHLAVYEVMTKGQGYGSYILNGLVEFARVEGYKYITLYAYDKRAEAFYQKLGFVNRTIRNCQIMRKLL